MNKLHIQKQSVCLFKHQAHGTYLQTEKQCNSSYYEQSVVTDLPALITFQMVPLILFGKRN